MKPAPDHPYRYELFNSTTKSMDERIVDPSDCEDTDEVIQIARSNFGDMIYDFDRNDRFEAGLAHHLSSLPPGTASVVDIGTGTGLLSLMAARLGAKRVTAVEMFLPMARTAEQVIASNGLSDRIRVIAGRSTDIDYDPAQTKADVIVAEVFDTELIGEGALRTFKSGLPVFGKPGCCVVPATGTIWVCPVASDRLQDFRRLPKVLGDVASTSCPGTAAVFDLQLGEIDSSWFTVLADPIVAFSFDFENPATIHFNESFNRQIVLKSSSRASSLHTFDTLLMWWDIDMDGTGTGNVISTVPPQFSSKAVWRDHWMQAIYYLPEPVTGLVPGDVVNLRCSHDEFSLWFSAGKTEKPESGPAFCTCGIHCALSRVDIYRLNDVDRNEEFKEQIRKVSSNKKVITLGEGSLIALYATESASHVTAVEECPQMRNVLREVITSKGLETILDVVASLDDVSVASVDGALLLSEPFFSTQVLPWQSACRFRSLVFEARNRGAVLDAFPKKMLLKCAPYKFDHLWKIAAPVGTISGFDLSDFDRLCQTARSIADPVIEQHSLYEYPGIVTGDTVVVAEIQTTVDSLPGEKVVKISSSISGTNGIVFWMDYDMDVVVSQTTGPFDGKLMVGKKAAWKPGYKQGVYFLPLDIIHASGANNLVSGRILVSPTEDGTDLDFQFAF